MVVSKVVTKIGVQITHLIKIIVFIKIFDMRYKKLKIIDWLGLNLVKNARPPQRDELRFEFPSKKPKTKKKCIYAQSLYYW
jgi:hypothetical protein